MALHISSRQRVLGGIAAIAASGIVLAGCAADGESTTPSSEPLIVGTTDRITSIDPAGSYDNGSFAVMNQVYPFLFNSQYGTSEVTPDIAESGEFTTPNEYTVTLKEGLTFANGNELTSSDVKFTFDRQLAIADPNGPSYLLGNLESVEAPDDTTVVFTLAGANDQTWEQILSSPAAPIVDEDVFSADSVTPDDDIVEGNAFAGQYVIDSYSVNELISYAPNPEYGGSLPAPENEGITVSYYTDASNLRLDIGNGDIDVAYRSLSATDIDDLSGNDDLQIVEGPGGEIRYIVFNFDTMPYGATTADADPERALAVRQAMADLIDREAIAEDVYRGTYAPLYSYVPQGLEGATEPLLELYGDGSGGPDVDAAAAVLEEAGVETPVTLNLQYNGDHYGPSSGDEYAAIAAQLEEGGLFEVDLAQTEWVQYSEDRTSDVYPMYQLGWFPDYSDADNYLTPFFADDNFLVNHYSNPEVQELITSQASETDPDARMEEIGQIQQLVAEDLSTLPLLQGTQVAVVGADVEGATLDGSFKFRYAPLHK